MAQQGCQVQSGVGWQDNQGALTGGESWETCVSCLIRLQTTSLCFTGPFFPLYSPPAPPPTPTTAPSTLHHPKKKKCYGATYIYVCGGGGVQTEEDIVWEKQRWMKGKVKRKEKQIIKKHTEEDGDEPSKCWKKHGREGRGTYKEKI